MNLTKQEITIFNQLVGLAIKYLENPANYVEIYNNWVALTSQLRKSRAFAIICRAGQQALDLYNEVNAEEVTK